ncbi:transcriptional regulator GutM [Anaerostipes sp.]|uniref:transcriptional regulator GutM n=1 Tax=Anaerostipes sp. TaxID=1872530 RepID=UPI0025BFD89E|nr:transcriptional regulator GutM [Anaerostipes sp.]MBS7009188.1 hypothetical protein [Anaerostipes sp.]
MKVTMAIVFGGIVAAWLLQGFFAYRQARNIQKIYKELTDRYARSYCIGFGQAKGRFFGKGCILLVVADRNMIVKDSVKLTGVSVLSRMRPNQDLIGRDLSLEIRKEEFLQETGQKKKKFRKKKDQRKTSEEKAIILAAKNIYDYINQKNHVSQA